METDSAAGARPAVTPTPPAGSTRPAASPADSPGPAAGTRPAAVPADSARPAASPAGVVSDGSRAEMVARLGSRRVPLTPSEIRAATRRLQQLAEPAIPLRLAVLRTYTTELLAPYWRFESLLQGLDLHLYETPYGSLRQEAEPGSGLAAADPDLVAVFLRWDDLDPRLSAPQSAVPPEDRTDLQDRAVATITGLATALRATTPDATLVFTLLPPLWGPELGLFDPMADHATLRAAIKAGIAAGLRTHPGALLADLDDLAAEVGRRQVFDLRLWETSRFPFSVAGGQEAVRRIIGYAAAKLLPRAKVIVLDADNTLWGGIVGEDGPLGIALGPDYPGSAYVTFQRRLLEYQQRGFLLALCSKNNPADVTEVLTRHPHQLLRDEHFAAIRVNWQPKPDNLKSLAKELNLGLDSFVFVDDSAHECLAVRQQIPEVTVVRTPAEPVDIPYCLDGLARLEILGRTDEDRRRTDLYAQERARREAAATVGSPTAGNPAAGNPTAGNPTAGSLEEHLASLDMRMPVAVDAEPQVARIAQLTRKTNQFNLTTRRYTEPEILALMRDPDALVAHFRLVDRFGDAGIVGVALVRGARGPVAEVDTLLMSCRVIGRRAELAFIRYVLSRLADRGVTTVVARYARTAKNEMVRDFWPSVGFAPSTTNNDIVTYEYNLRAGPPDLGPLPIQIEEEE